MTWADLNLLEIDDVERNLLEIGDVECNPQIGLGKGHFSSVTRKLSQ